MRKMKKFLTLALALAMSVTLLAGCGGNGGSASSAEPADSSSTSSAADDSSSAGGTKQVVVGINADYTTFDPAYSYEKSARMIQPVVYDTLVQFDRTETGKINPSLAESWTISDDKLTYVFKLREDVVASTGKTLNAADVVFCFDRLKNLKGNPSFLADPIEKVEATGDFEVTLTLNTVTPSILAVLTEGAFGIYDSEVAQQNGATGDPTTDTAQAFFDGQSIGSGPFILTSYTPNAELVIEKNPNYRGEAPKLDRVVFRHMNDASMQLMSLQKGDIDFAFDLTAAQLETLNDPNIVVNTYPTLDIFMLQLNMDPAIGGPLAVKEVRQAIAYALDYDGLCAIAGNDAKVPYNIIPNGFAGYLGESPIKRDLDKAKELLAQAGYADGFAFECGVIPDMATDGVSFMDCAVKMQADLAEVGITMNIQPDEVSVYLEKLRGGQYQSSVGMWGPDYVDPATQLSFLPGQNVGMRSNWTAEMAPELAELGSRAAVEIDDAARVKLFEEIQTLYNEVAGPNLVYLQPNRALAASTRVKDVYYTPSNMLDFSVMDVQ